MAENEQAILRRATNSDIATINQLIIANQDSLTCRDETEVADLIESFWVLELGTETIGCVCLEIYNSRLAEVRSLVIRTDHRGAGHGSTLVRRAMADAAEIGVQQVLVLTSKPEFFEGLGFQTRPTERFAVSYNPAMNTDPTG